MVMALCSQTTNLISLGVFTHERLVIGGKGWSVVVDVQHSDVHGHSAYLSRVVWETQRWTRSLHVNNCYLTRVTQNMCATIALSPGKLIIPKSNYVFK